MEIATGAATGTATDLVRKIYSTVGRQVGYLIHYKRNRDDLKTEVGKLSVAKAKVSEKINEAEGRGEMIHSHILDWLNNVATITEEARKLLKEKQQATIEDANNSQPKTKCVHGFCPNLMLLRRRSKNWLALIERVTELINKENELSDISYVPPKDLRTEVNELIVAKDTVAENVREAEAKGEKIHADVQEWLKSVAEIVKMVEEFLKDKQQPVEVTSDFMKDEIQAVEKPTTSLSHGSKELELLQRVTELYKMREFSDISYIPPKDLQTEVGKLRDSKDTVAENVSEAEAKGEKIHANVQSWLKRVADIVKEVEEFLKDKHQSIEETSEFMKGEIQAIEKPNTSLSHGSKELELLQRVAELYEMREFSKISYVLPAEDVCMASEEDYEKFDSRTSILEEILKELGTSSSEMLLVYGVGGVGKTTLVEEVLRKTQKEKFFEDAVMVRDVKIPNLEEIQNQIADKLRLDISKIKTLPGRADKINERIKDKKTLVIFDDVWGELDLKAVGLPHKSTCRILLTSRSQQVFSHKIKQKEFLLGVLDEKEAWALFEKKAGDVVADPSIQNVATEVAKKCGGLPVFIITVARALENKTLPIWKNALRCLERFDEKGDLTEKAYLGIEWSYKQLSVKDQLQPLFLLCGLIAKGNYASFTDLLKYSIGLGFFEDCTVEDARNALYQQVDKLKSSCLLLDGDDGTCVRMHDLVHDVANRIAYRDHHVLVEDGGHERKKWPNEDFFTECSKICLPCGNIATLPQVPWKCPKLEMFHLRGEDDYDSQEYYDREDDDDSSPNIPSNFFVEMKNLKVLGLSKVPLLPLPSSFSFLKNLQTLCLDGCMFEDIALVGELRNLEVLSLVKSNVQQLPKEIGQLTRLRLVDLSDCDELEVIPAGVISNWTRLEDLRMRNSFTDWESQRWPSNASLLELMSLPKLTALEVLIPDTDILPAKFFSDRLEKYQIFIELEGWHPMYETTVNKLILGPNTRYELDQGLKALLKRCGDLRFTGAKDVDFSFIMKTEVVMSSLTTLQVSNCDGLKYLLSSSMARSLVKLKRLTILNCKAMEEIVSTRESQNNIIDKLEILQLDELPNLARFCTAGSCIEFPSLERLYMGECSKLGESTAKDTTFHREIQERELDENFQAHNETCSQNFLFDEKIRSPRLEILQISCYGTTNRFLQTIWHNQLDPSSFCRLREVSVENCVSLRSIFPPSMMGRLSALETLNIIGCKSMEVVFDERRETNVNETYGTSTTQLKDGQNLKSVDIYNCQRLKYIFPASMVTRGLQQLQKMKAGRCDEMESVVAKEEGTLESTRHPNFVFPKVESMIFESMQRLKSFYPGMYISEWPLLKHFEFVGEVEIFAAELSVFQEKQMHAPTKQPFLLIDKGSFPVLEKLEVSTAEILYGPSSFQVVMSSLTTLKVSNCDGLKYLLSSSMARSLVKLKRLKISNCKAMEEIVSIRESQNNIISKLEILELDELPNLARFCTAGSCIEFPSLERLYVRRCSKLGESTAKDTTFRREIQKRELDENFQAHNETCSQNFLFDEKIRSPRLEILQIISYYGLDYKNRFLQTIWHNQLDPGSFCRLREVSVENCVSLRSIFPPSMMGRLSALETLDIKGCESMEVVFDERRETNVNETHGTSTTQLKDGQNLKSVDIYNCHRLKYIFPASMVTGGLQQLQKMKAGRCDEMESVVAKEEGTLESTRHPNFVFPKVESMIFESMQRLKSFYPGMYISEWPLLKHFKFIGEVEIFAAELSVFQEKQMHAPTKQPFLLIDKGSFPVLEKLEVSTAEILYGPSSSPVESIFSKLKSIGFYGCEPFSKHAVVVLSSLTTLEVSNCDGFKYLLSSSMARSLVKLKRLKISNCKAMEEIVSTRESQNNIIDKLEILQLDGLPNLARFCTAGSCIEFPSLERLYMRECSKLGESTAKDTTFRREIQERELDENFQAHNETCSQNFLFDEKIRSPRLEILLIINSYRYGKDYENSFLQTIWHNQLDPGSFCRLREVRVENCDNLRSIFPPSMMGRLSALETLNIKGCKSMEVVFDERRETNVNETHGTSTTQLKDGQNLKSVDIYNCHRLKYIFPASMVTGGLQQLQKMKAGRCDEMESVVAKEEGTLESTRHPNFVFPKVESMIFEYMRRLKSFYPGMYISEWPLLKHFKFVGLVEIFAAELSVFQEKQMHAPTKQPFLLIDKGSFPVLEKLAVSTAKNLYGCGETVRVGSLPRVRVPNLESHNGSYCLRLENLPSSAAFQNLTTLEVYGCDGLKCLAPSSVAKSLVQLTNLTVTHCKEIVVLVAGNEDEDDDTENEIAFSRLQYLTLYWLHSLQGFCSRNCTAKLPLSITVVVDYCPIQLKISPDGVPIAESDEEMKMRMEMEMQMQMEMEMQTQIEMEMRMG